MDVKISLTNLQSSNSYASPPREIRNKQISQLFYSMLEAESPQDYQFSAIALQHQLLKKAKSEKAQLPIRCPHPEWFKAIGTVMVDETICRFCGFGPYCELNQRKRKDTISVINLDHSPMPSQEYFEESFLAFDKNHDRKKIDPFFGFSFQAQTPRNLYWVSQSHFTRCTPDVSPYHKQETAIGYDVITQQSIWPLDQLFMELFSNDKVKFNLKKYLEASCKQTPMPSKLLISDRKPMMNIGIELGWIRLDDNDQFREAFHILVNRLAFAFASCEIGQKKLGSTTNRHFHELSLESVTAGVDHPFLHGGSGLLQITLRSLVLEPNFLEKYLEILQTMPDDPLLTEQKEIIGRIMIEDSRFDNIENKIHKNLGRREIDFERRYFPRFPMIAFAPEDKISELQLEQAAGRIIDIIIAPISEICLMIDGLGIDLEKEGPWSNVE